MALVFWDGSEGFASSADLTEKWNALGAVVSMVSGTTVRTGALGTRSWNGNSGTAGTFNYITVSNLTTVIVEFWFKPNQNVTVDVLVLRDSSDNTHFKITRVVSGANMVLRAIDANGSQVGTDYNAGSSLGWVHVGVKVVIGASGAATVRFDDVVHLNAVAGDYLNGSNAFVSRVGFCASATGNTTTFFDDIVIMDTSGSDDNDFKGSSIHCVASYPTAAGDSTQWTPSAGSNYQNVDETDPDDDTTYNSSSSSGQLDLYNITDLPAFSGNVLGVDIWARIRKTTGGTEETKLALKTNTVVYYGSNDALTSSYAMYRKLQILNPNTGIRFTQSEANALQVGVEVI